MNNQIKAQASLPDNPYIDLLRQEMWKRGSGDVMDVEGGDDDLIEEVMPNGDVNMVVDETEKNL